MSVGVSFKFGKSHERQELTTSSNAFIDAKDRRESQQDDDDDRIEAEREHVTHLEHKKIRSASKKEKVKQGPLVIPMITKNRWTINGSLDEEELRNKAKAALIAEADNDLDELDTSGSVPLLIANHVPKGFEEEEGRIDVSLRAEEATGADYDSVPIDDFGFAMLRGMGWKEGTPIGKSNKGVVTAKVPELRPKGLGLGADRSIAKQLATPTASSSAENQDKDEKKLKIGAPVKIISGPHRQMYGKVESFDEDNARLMVRLAIGSNMVNVSRYGIELITQKEYEKDSKCINKSNYDRYKEKTDHVGLVGKKREGSPDVEVIPIKKAKSEIRRKEEKRKSSHPWVRADLRVRVIDKSIKNGRYYNNKVIIVDVAGIDDCTCKTEDGKLLEGIRQRQIETVIPRDESCLVMIVSGEHRGEVGKVVERNKKKSRAFVQLLRSPDIVAQLDYDHICEFVGDASIFVE